jgi:hypothetical protein
MRDLRDLRSRPPRVTEGLELGASTDAISWEERALFIVGCSIGWELRWRGVLLLCFFVHCGSHRGF